MKSKLIKYSLITAMLANTVGCATATNPNDPYEAYNRKVFIGNAILDTLILRPITVGYVTVVPDPVIQAVTNVYQNLRDFVSLGNDILQLNYDHGMNNLMRISINTTWGLLGLIDVASALGLPKERNTFGNTMKVYGWETSHYFLVPIFPPGTMRDQIGVVPDMFLNPNWYVFSDFWVSLGNFSLNQLDSRAQILPYDTLFSQSVDPYATVRDWYLKANNEYTGESAENLEISNEVSEYLEEENESASIHKNLEKSAKQFEVPTTTSASVESI